MALNRIIVLLLVSNMCIGVAIAVQRNTVTPLHVIYATVVLLPFLGIRFIQRYAAPHTHAKYMCVALLLILVILHRLVVTASH